MDGNQILRDFARIGARAVVEVSPLAGQLRLDVRADNKGEYFDVRVGNDIAVRAVDIRPGMRHLLLLADNRDAPKDRFLCGHDERHWFVAAVPGDRGISGVRTAMEALKPEAVRDAQARLGLRNSAQLRRKNRAFTRQGEWFFVPAPEMVIDPDVVLRNEPISRGRGKPHMVERLARIGGELVYVSRRAPNGITPAEYRALMEREPAARRSNWRTMVRNAVVFATGRVRHPDHATIHLNGWHRVEMNTESRAPAMRHVAFLD
jgi:hypothetical protein